METEVWPTPEREYSRAQRSLGKDGARFASSAGALTKEVPTPLGSHHFNRPTHIVGDKREVNHVLHGLGEGQGR